MNGHIREALMLTPGTCHRSFESLEKRVNNQ